MMKKEMSALPEPVKSFNEELAEMLTQKPPVSSSKMKDITRCAMKAQKYYKHIVMSVEKLIQKCKPEFKLSSIYVIDAIVRQSRHQNKDRDVYAGRFESNLHLTASHLFKSSKSDQVKICRTFKLWELSKVFSYHSIQKCLNNANPDTRKEGVQLAEDSFAKMAVEKPPVNPDIKKQQKELEDQRRKITEQQEELKRKQEALFQQNSAAIPPILGNLLHFGQQINDQTDEPAAKAAETAKKVKSLLDDFDYSDEDEIKQPGKKVTPKMKSPPPTSTPKKSENVATPSPVTAAHNTSIYEPDPPDDAQDPPVFAPPKTEKYDTKNLEKLYTPSPVDKTSKKSKHKSPERSREKDKKSHKSERSNSSKRDSDRSRDRDRSPDRSRDRSKEKSSSRRRSSAEKRSSKTSSSRSGKRSRSASPDHYSKKRERISKADCATVLSFTIWIGNLRKTVTKEDIGSLMKKYTESCSIDMVPPRGCAYINVGNRQTAETVLKEFKDLKLHGATCKVAWAPGKGCKELKDHWNIEKGATFIPYKTFEKLKISSLEDGGEILETTLPDGFKIEESEGAGTILEKLLVSMKETSCDDDKSKSAENPLGQFLTNGRETAYITKQEEQVSAKLDMLDDIPMPGSVSQDSKKPPDDDSIVHLLNSDEYALPMPDQNPEETDYYYPGMSPPVSLDIPKDHVLPTSALTSPLAEEPLPYSRPIDEIETPPAEPLLDDSPMKLEKKTINLQTYLKRKKDDDPVTPVKEETPEELPPTTPLKIPKDNDVDDDLIEWASQDTEDMNENESQSQELTPEKTPDNNLDKLQTPEKLPHPDKVEVKTPDQLYTPEKALTETPEKTDNSQESVPDTAEDLEATIASIRSPSSSPVDSLLEEKLASPTASTPNKAPAAAPTNENMEEGELEPESDEEKKTRATSSKKDSRSRSQSHSSKKPKKEKKKKTKKKKKKDTGFDSDLEEDIRKLEFLKAELEREERREKKEKEKRRERKRSGSPKLTGKERKKIKREQRHRRQ